MNRDKEKQPSKDEGNGKWKWKGKNKDKDILKVYCRIRPVLKSRHSVEFSDTSTVMMADRNAPGAKEDGQRETYYTFSGVFDSGASQEDVFEDVAKPLVQDLIHRKNGLLFACGATNSGKTYTLTGSPSEPGILPRALDMLFNSIDSLLTRKSVFNPDGTTGPMFKKGKDLLLKRQKPNNRRNKADPEPEQQYCYSVFLRYYEVYNEYIYDLLLPPNDKNFRETVGLLEDRRKHKGVPLCTQEEVFSAKDAIQVFKRGQNYRTDAHRVEPKFKQSHAVVTLKLVSAPIDADGNLLPQRDNKVNVSQLCMVDLDGTKATLTVDAPVCMNNDQVELLEYITAMRKSQRTRNKMTFPTTKETLMKLFDSHFDGEGNVGLIACVSPNIDQHAVTKWLMTFAEDNYEVTVE